MSHFLLFYDYVEDIIDRRGPHREAHLAHARDNEAIVMAGAVGDPPHGAVFVFTSDAGIAEFVDADPYLSLIHI